MIPTRNLPAHLARVQGEEADIVVADIDEVAARTFALALTDGGSDTAAQPSKLWTSRSEFQEAAGRDYHLHSTSPPISDIVEGVARLAVTGSSSSPTIDNITPPNTVSAPTSVRDHSAAPNIAPAPFSLSPQNCTQEQRRMQKKEKSSRTTKVLDILAQIDLKINTCQQKLNGTPILDVLREVETTVSRLYPAVEKIKRDTPSIKERKRYITEQLDSLETRISQWRLLMPVSTPDPVSYNSGV